MKRTEGTPEVPEQAPKAKKLVKTIEVKVAPEDEPVGDIASAAEEVNESLKAMVPDLGKTEIKTIETEGELASADNGEVEGPLSEAPVQEVEAAEAEHSMPLEPTEVESESDSESQTDNETVVASDIEQVDKLPEENETNLDDEATEQAIKEIVAEESDTILEVEDAFAEAEETDEPAKKGRLRAFLTNLWSTPARRWGVIGGAAALILIVALLPYSRYFVLNTVGIRSSLSIRVIDNGTLQPLKNVKVSAAGISGQTDSEGRVKLEKLRLGRTKLLIEKRAFSNSDQFVTIGWGSNPLGDFKVNAVGSQYTFYIKDFLSDKPIQKVEAASGEGNASSDQEGKLILTLDTAEFDDNEEITVDITAENYRPETIKLTVSNKEAQSVKLVPSHRHVFVSKRSGKYDVYTVHVDGKNELKIVPGTGLERDDITLLPYQNDSAAALVATRENVRNSDGYLLSTLYIVDTETGDMVKIDQSEQIQVVGWSRSGRLVYVKIAAGASGANPKRHRLMSFNSQDYSDVKELASSNSFNDVVMADDKIYFAPSNIFGEAGGIGLYVVNPDGQAQKTILDKEVYNIFRSTYDSLDISTGATWYSYTLDSDAQAKVSGAPSSQFSKIFADNSANNFSLWVDSRDGKGVLLNYDRSTKSDTTLINRSGLKTPVYWLNDKYAVFRVNDGKETADYVLNTEGDEPKKIMDVTDTNGVDRWFYY